MPRTLGLVGATTLAFALLAPTAAQADTWGSSDPSGDVRGVRSDPDPAPCGTDTVLDASNETNVDITALGVRHTRRSVVVTTRFRDIVAEHEHHLTFSIRTPKEKFEYDVYRSDPRSGEWQIFSLLFVQPHYPAPEDTGPCGEFGFSVFGLRCRVGRTFSFAHDLVRLEFPRGCFGDPRWVRVGVRASFSAQDGRSWEYYSDEWDNGGEEVSPWLPPIGPRVEATHGAAIGGDLPDGGLGAGGWFRARFRER